MALFGFLGLKKAPSAKQLRDMLPALHSFVDVAVKNGPKGSVCFENAGVKTFVTSALPGMAAGQSANFLYSNTGGRYRFTATITAVDDKQATFAIPGRIETVQKFAGTHKRTTVRVDTTVAVQWRYAPTGKIQTEWQKAVVSDISRTGCSLTTEKAIKAGNTLELKMPLLAGGEMLVVRAEAMRVSQIETSKKSNIGLKYAGISAETDRAILDYINRRQTALRGRGLG
jgi:c-di-GMP-binding flagellar brake protein YcgR